MVVVAAAAVFPTAVVAWNSLEYGEATLSRNAAYNLYIGNRDFYAEDLDLFHPRATREQIEFRRQMFAGTLQYPTGTAAQLQAAAPYATESVVRVPWNDMVTIKRTLDIGARSILIPYVQTEEEARNAVAYTRYPPQGVRGVAATTRATRFGRVKNYPKLVHEELCVLVQIETELGLKNLEAIAAV